MNFARHFTKLLVLAAGLGFGWDRVPAVAVLGASDAECSWEGS